MEDTDTITEPRKRTTLAHDRFQVLHQRHGLMSCHKSFMLAWGSARREVAKLKAEHDAIPWVQVYDAMARSGKPQLYRITGTSLESSDYFVEKTKA